MGWISLSASPDLLRRHCHLPPVSAAWALVGPLTFHYTATIACYGSIIITWGPGGKILLWTDVDPGTQLEMPFTFVQNGMTTDLGYWIRLSRSKEMWGGWSQSSWTGKAMNCVIASFVILSPLAYFPRDILLYCRLLFISWIEWCHFSNSPMERVSTSDVSPSTILWSGMWRVSFRWLVCGIDDSTSPTVGIPALGKGWWREPEYQRWRSGTASAVFTNPIKIDCQGQRTARPGMLGPWLPSVSNFMSFPKTTVFLLNVLKHYLWKKVKFL